MQDEIAELLAFAEGRCYYYTRIQRLQKQLPRIQYFIIFHHNTRTIIFQGAWKPTVGVGSHGMMADFIIHADYTHGRKYLTLQNIILFMR